MMLWMLWLLACGGEPDVPEPPAEGAAGVNAAATDADATNTAGAEGSADASAESDASAPADPSKTEFTSVPWLGFDTIPEGMKGCRLDQKLGNSLFDNSVAMRCGKGGRLLAASVSTERWEASASALSTQAEAALGAPEKDEQTLGWSVKTWTKTRSAVTALLQRDGTTVYIGCVDGPAELTCGERMAQLITGLGKPTP